MINKQYQKQTSDDEGVRKFIKDEIAKQLAEKCKTEYDDQVKVIKSICKDIMQNEATLTLDLSSITSMATYFFAKGREFGEAGDCKMRFESTSRRLV